MATYYHWEYMAASEWNRQVLYHHAVQQSFLSRAGKVSQEQQRVSQGRLAPWRIRAEVFRPGGLLVAILAGALCVPDSALAGSKVRIANISGSGVGRWKKDSSTLA